MSTKLRCTKCPATADLKDSPNAWDGWQVVPNHECPECIAKGLAMKGIEVKRNVFRGKVISTFHVAGQT